MGAVVARLQTMALPIACEIILVNDGSSDDTRAVLDGLAPGPGLRIIHAEVNGGKGSAIRRGLREAEGTIVAIQDADLELDPAQIADLVGPILAGEYRFARH